MLLLDQLVVWVQHDTLNPYPRSTLSMSTPLRITCCLQVLCRQRCDDRSSRDTCLSDGIHHSAIRVHVHPKVTTPTCSGSPRKRAIRLTVHVTYRRMEEGCSGTYSAVESSEPCLHPVIPARGSTTELLPHRYMTLRFHTPLAWSRRRPPFSLDNLLCE